jgi:hypothetical protein
MINAIVVVAVALGLGFSIYTIAYGVAGPGKRRGAPPLLRGLILVWLAISLAVFVLVWLGGFQHADQKIVVVVFAILGLLAVLDHAAARRRGSSG